MKRNCRVAMLAIALVLSGTGMTLAADILYTFESADPTGPAPDDLVGDGLQNGALEDYPVRIDADRPVFGLKALAFDPTSAIAVVPIPGTTGLGTQVTLGVHLLKVPAGHHRLFSSFNGSSTWDNELIVDFDPDGEILSTGFGLRVLYNGSSLTVSSASLPDWSDSDTPHHIAVTWNSGNVTVFFDGSPMASGSIGSGSLVLSRELQIGEDYGQEGAILNNQVNEALRGVVDDVFVVRKVLTGPQITTIASSGAAVVLSAPSASGDVLYTMEGDEGFALTDKLADAGAENAFLPWPGPAFNSVSPAIGLQSLTFSSPAVFEIPGTTNLGSQVTLAAHLKSVPAGHRRLFSAYDGGSAASGDQRLVIDFDADLEVLDTGWAIRFYYNGSQGVVPTFVMEMNYGDWSNDPQPHHLAFTWNSGTVGIYFDGNLVNTLTNPDWSGDLVLTLGDLRVGEDYPAAYTPTEPLLGTLDDVVVVRRVLSPAEIASMAAGGAQAVLTGPSSPGDVLYT
ncbi:MAG: hypothetical protein JXB13_18770, partial [Phycisphaerae bacterium]|nr:hypothetical protein [Phycisphaerae bacterium]